MHVIPVEEAIPAETQTASYEQLSHWLKKYDKIAVGDCSCRITRRLMGEGCGHLEKDMCIALGDVAEFAVKTGRAHWITYEECLEILKKAEDSGLVHQITNVDGRTRFSASATAAAVPASACARRSFQHAEHVPLQFRGEN